MAKMTLSKNTFTLIPEGFHIFKVMQVDDSKYENFGKLAVKLQTADGKTHIEHFSLKTARGGLNEGALKAWSFFARTCLNNMDAEEIDTQDIVGCYIGSTVEHETFTKRDGTEGTSARLKKYSTASGFKADAPADEEDAVDDDLDDLDDFE